MTRFTSRNPADIAWRRQQMSANNDIEQVGRDAGAEELISRLREQGVSTAEGLTALRSYFITTGQTSRRRRS